MKKNTVIISIVLVCSFFIFSLILIGAISKEFNSTSIIGNKYNNTFNIISSSENEDIESIIKDFAIKNNIELNIEYAGTLDIMQKLNAGEKYDAVWLSNSIWGYMLDSSVVSLSNSKSTSINPVIFGIKKSKAEELGLTNKTVYTKDIVDSIAQGKLKFSMSNPTSTNSGASAYLGMLATLAGNPEVLTEANLNNEELKNNLKSLFTGMERSSGSEDFLEELFLNGDYEAVVAYESSIININKQLEKQGKETLYAIYPVDGVSIADSPFSYIDNKNEVKKEQFLTLQNYILSNEGQNRLATTGRRTWFGGINKNADKSIFNPNWGIDTKNYITPIKYPSTSVIKLALNMYQTELRKPVHVVFCLDYSGSMYGDGNKQLINAMNYILTQEASKDFIQFASKDKIDVIPFDTYVNDPISTLDGTQTSDILSAISLKNPYGSTALYPAAQKALEILQSEDTDSYNCSIILMTDGMANVGSFVNLSQTYRNSNKKIPIYSIMFGDADEYELNQIADLTNAKVFDGKSDLVQAFKEVRGYN